MMVYHTVIINVQSNTSDGVLDIMENDKNSHDLLIKLVKDNGKYYNVSGYTPQIAFYDENTQSVVTSTAVDIVNAQRGYLSYILGERILTNPSRYTVTLKLYENGGGNCAKLTTTFILNVLRDPSCLSTCSNESNVEVTISKKFYDEIKCHLDNRLIHLSDQDRMVLHYLSDNLNDLVTHQEFDPVKDKVDEMTTAVDDLTWKQTNGVPVPDNAMWISPSSTMESSDYEWESMPHEDPDDPLWNNV